ncbi:MAG: hypothetical protein JWP12_2553, partial [Bacteroidetes bacterium]|nr:hypothetical protein [Bacteroidota bacterium]
MVMLQNIIVYGNRNTFLSCHPGLDPGSVKYLQR